MLRVWREDLKHYDCSETHLAITKGLLLCVLSDGVLLYAKAFISSKKKRVAENLFSWISLGQRKAIYFESDEFKMHL